jgi:hypothetical protein
MEEEEEADEKKVELTFSLCRWRSDADSCAK